MAAFDPKQTLSGILVTTLSVERRLLIGVHHDASGLSAMESVTFISRSRFGGMNRSRPYTGTARGCPHCEPATLV